MLQKLQDRERAQQAQEQKEREPHKGQSPLKSPHMEQSQLQVQAIQVPPDRVSPQQLETKRATVSIMA
ncbi:hypothetical protein, partial [Blautia marasmi]|uniref:hypothetical protein n=1 Tax=Blautia marasmi TaxID=1917868 RepID=UPI00210C7240